MSDFVELSLRRNRGWPWPEGSWGLTPMFGEHGWCHACGVPQRPQCGSLVLQRKGFTTGVEGAWVPNWQFDVICLDGKLGARVAKRFDVELLEVGWRGTSPGDAVQIVAPTVGDAWFDPDELRAATIARHGTDGARCSECGVWRWMPLDFTRLARLRISPALGDVDVAASPEWFGDGWQAFRQVLLRRPLAEMIAAASPRDFVVSEVR